MQKTKIIEIICLVIVFVGAFIHLAPVASGYDYYTTRKYWDKTAAYIVMGFLFLLAGTVVGVINTAVKAFLNEYMKVGVVFFLLVIEYSIAITVAIVASQLSMVRTENSSDNLKAYHNAAVADTVISFIFKIPACIVLIYIGLKELKNGPAVEGEGEAENKRDNPYKTETKEQIKP